MLFIVKTPPPVKYTTLITLLFFAWVKLLTPFRCGPSGDAKKLLATLEKKGYKFVFNLLVMIMRSYAYVQGIKEALDK